MKINLSRPDITEKEIEAVCEVLRSPNLSLGPKLGEFEQSFCDYIGKKRAVAVNSGTSGLFLCLLAMGIGEGDEVITTPFTFIASATSIMMTGAKPVFADIDDETLNIDPARLEEKINENTKAILPVEVFGNPAGFEEICAVARKHDLLILEDSCEALGSVLNGKKCGSLGDMSVFAFYPNKQMTTGEGGMILTDNDEWADACVALRNQGRAPGSGWLSHDMLGYNYRLSDINCALGIVQLSRIGEFKKKRAQVAEWYQEMLSDEARVILPAVKEGVDMSWFVFVIRLGEKYNKRDRDKLMQFMMDNEIGVNNYFSPLHMQPFIKEKLGLKEGDFPVTESISSRTVALPFYNNLSRQEVAEVCSTLKNGLDLL